MKVELTADCPDVPAHYRKGTEKAVNGIVEHAQNLHAITEELGFSLTSLRVNDLIILIKRDPGVTRKRNA